MDLVPLAQKYLSAYSIDVSAAVVDACSTGLVGRALSLLRATNNISAAAYEVCMFPFCILLSS